MATHPWLPPHTASPLPCSFARLLPPSVFFRPKCLNTIVGFLRRQASTKLLVGSRRHVFVTSHRRWNSMMVTAALDPDLHAVLELASDDELFELSNILYGQSLLSPLLKSVTPGDGSRNIYIDDKRHEDEPEGRDALMERLESRFLFLGADAKSILRGKRPTYRDVLLCVRMKLNVPCAVKLSTEDLEAEIFLHLLQQYSSNESESFLRSPWKHQSVTFPAKEAHVPQDPKKLRSYLLVALKLGGEEILKVMLKGGSVFTISTLQNMMARRIGGKVLLERARYQVTREVLRKGGQAAASRLQTHVAMLTAKQGLAKAASCYMALQRTSMLLGPLLWGTFLAEIVIRSVGTDYARVVKAIYAFAQIRLLRTYGWTRSGQTFSH